MQTTTIGLDHFAPDLTTSGFVRFAACLLSILRLLKPMSIRQHSAKTLRRGSASTFFANLPPCLVGMEASNGAHYWARVLTELGHKVRLISPQFVAPYVKSNKNDRIVRRQSDIHQQLR